MDTAGKWTYRRYGDLVDRWCIRWSTNYSGWNFGGSVGGEIFSRENAVAITGAFSERRRDIHE
jgi:hypothetical protein